MKAYLTLDPQNSPTANWYPELKNDTCVLSPSYKSGNVVIPAVTNTTACEHGYFQGGKTGVLAVSTLWAVFKTLR